MFVTNPDRSVATISGVALKRLWDEINGTLWTKFSALSGSDWLKKHSSVSEEDFAREPHRNRFTILLGRTSHIAYHFGQAKLAERR
jgi:hypothetical protein